MKGLLLILAALTGCKKKTQQEAASQKVVGSVVKNAITGAAKDVAHAAETVKDYTEAGVDKLKHAIKGDHPTTVDAEEVLADAIETAMVDTSSTTAVA